jgi:hypothetical protein
MGGGLMQLVAYGAQDIYLTGNPQITFFKVVYRRHTNFSMESIQQTLDGTVGPCKKVSCTISRNGDLIHKMYLRIHHSAANCACGASGIPTSTEGYMNKSPIPMIPDTAAQDDISVCANDLINSVEIEIGGQKIDKHYGDWLNIWTQLSTPASKNVGLEELLNLKKGKYSYVPLQFWFCRNPGLALPLIALQYHEVKLNIEFNKSKSGGSCTGAMCELTPDTADWHTASLWVDYIYLDTDERRRFAQVSHEYLIEQLQFTGTETLTSGGSKGVELNFNHPVKELVWRATGMVATTQTDKRTDTTNNPVVGYTARLKALEITVAETALATSDGTFIAAGIQGGVGTTVDSSANKDAVFTVTNPGRGGVYTFTVTTAGSGYTSAAVGGETIVVKGSLLGGSDGTNDATLTVTANSFAGFDKTHNDVTEDSVGGNGSATVTVHTTGSGGAYTFTATTAGSGYAIGDKLVILGSALGGVNVTNDCTITTNAAGGFAGTAAGTPAAIAAGTTTLSSGNVAITGTPPDLNRILEPKDVVTQTGGFIGFVQSGLASGTDTKFTVSVLSGTYSASEALALNPVPASGSLGVTAANNISSVGTATAIEVPVYKHAQVGEVVNGTDAAGGNVCAAASWSDVTLQLNGHERFSERHSEYFRLVQPLQHHTSIPADSGIHVYSFALKPEEHQPSGTCNFSRIDSAVLKLAGMTTLNGAADEAGNPMSGATLRVYAVNYNVLRIMSGMGGLAYSN